MASWRDEVINQFKYESGPLLLVHDQDFLLNNEIILHELAAQGFDVIRYEDSVSFRYIYESQYRQLDCSFKLIVYTNDNIIFPYEYIRFANQINLSITDIFSKMSARIVRELDVTEYDELYQIYSTYYGTDTDEATIEFFLKHLYKIPYDIITTEADLYAYLLSLHYEKRILIPSVQNYLFNQWNKINSFQSLPLRQLLKSQTYFYNYLEEMWNTFVEKVTELNDDQVNDANEWYMDHPLVNHDVRRLLNDLFIEGAIKRVKVENNINIPDWIKIGVEEKREEDEYNAEKQIILHDKIVEKLKNNKHYKEWIKITQLLSEYTAMTQTDKEFVDKQQKLFNEANEQFSNWISKEYHTLISLPPYPNPKLVHHIPQVIQNEKRANEKVALLVLDGMSFMQWRIIEKYLQKENFIFEESGVFAWVPTLTSVSRQAIFSGLMPLQFVKTINTTANEEKLWRSFWEKHNVPKQYVTYQKSMGQERYNSKNIIGLTKKATKAYGAVIDVIDQFSHHAVMGERSIAAELSIWLQSGYLTSLLNDLLDANYTLYVTSDHGNTIATGIGRYDEGVLVEQRGERVRLYGDEYLYEEAKSTIPGLPWSNAGLPEDYYALFSKYREAYTTKEKQVVTHGGMSIEEVIVPFVKVNKNKGRE